MADPISNPFRPGAGHRPPYLAGRESEKTDFRKLLEQPVILTNLVLTGLRGVGKTVLLEEFRELATEQGFLWVGADLSETASLSEENVAIRLLTDLSAATAGMVIGKIEPNFMGFRTPPEGELRLDYPTLVGFYEQSPGLVLDRLKAVVQFVCQIVEQHQYPGIVFAYDEAQNLTDHSDRNQFPLSMLLDLFQSIQRMERRALLVLTGLPPLFPKLVDARTFAERMFHVMQLSKLDETASRDAILKPIAEREASLRFEPTLVQQIIDESSGYPYFIQFLCREIYDAAIRLFSAKQPLQVNVSEISRKLDTDFFSGRWSRATDRQRVLLKVAADVEAENQSEEFSIQDLAQKSQAINDKPFSPSHISQMLTQLVQAGLIYRNRHARYSFAVPLLGRFIRRQVI